MLNLVSLKPKILRFIPKPRFWLKPGYRQAVLILVLGLGLTALLAWGRPVYADLAKDYLWPALSWILVAISALLGQVLMWEISFLISISGYNDFLNARVVTIGWSLVRDVANMFYILVMLIIAFGTMFKLEQYSWKKLLPRLILTAILVNFSKTIVGLFIDFAQVIMLTFVNGYSAAAGGNFLSLFKIKELFSSTAQVESFGDLSYKIVLGFLLGTVMLGVSVIVIGVFVLILLCRILTLWVLIVLAPMAFMLGTFPKGQEYYADWWKRLTNNIIVGPVLAFFLWLSLAALGGGDNQDQVLSGTKSLAGEQGSVGSSAIETGTEAGEWDSLASFAVSIAMLFIALQMTQQLGVTGAGLASGAAGWMKSKATGLVKGAVAKGGWGRATADWTTRRPREAMWGGLAKAPIIGNMAARRMANLRQQRLAKAQEGLKGIQYLKTDELLNVARGSAITPTSKAQKWAALNRGLRDPDFVKKLKPGEAIQMTEDFKKLGETTYNKETTNDTIKKFKKENLRFNNDKEILKDKTTGEEMKDELTGQPLTEMSKTVREIHPRNIKDVSDFDLADPNVAECFTDEQVGFMSQRQKAIYSKAKDSKSEEKAMKKLGLSEEDRQDTKKVQEAVGEKGMPSVVSKDLFGKLKIDQKVDALKVKAIEVDDIDAKDLSANNGELAGAVALSDKPDLIDRVVKQHPQEFKKGIVDQSNSLENKLNGNKAVIKERLGDDLKDLEKKRNDVNDNLQLARMGAGEDLRKSYPSEFGNLKDNEILEKLNSEKGDLDTQVNQKAAAFEDFQVSENDKKERTKLVDEQKILKKSWLPIETRPEEAFKCVGYKAPETDKPEDKGKFERGGAEILAETVRSNPEPMSWERNLKVEAVVKKLPDGKIVGLTELGRVLAQSSPINRMLLLGQKDLAAALIGAKKAFLTPGSKEAKRLDKRLEASAFEDLVDAIDKAGEEIRVATPKKT